MGSSAGEGTCTGGGIFKSSATRTNGDQHTHTKHVNTIFPSPTLAAFCKMVMKLGFIPQKRTQTDKSRP